MTVEATAAARQLAAGLAETFREDREAGEQQRACEQRLRAANARLWSGVDPGALGLLDADAAALGVYPGASMIGAAMRDALGSGLPAAEVEAAVLDGLQEAHWMIDRAFAEYQRLSEERRHLAVEIGELAARLVGELTAAGWTEEAARTVDVHQLTATATLR